MGYTEATMPILSYLLPMVLRTPDGGMAAAEGSTGIGSWELRIDNSCALSWGVEERGAARPSVLKGGKVVDDGPGSI